MLGAADIIERGRHAGRDLGDDPSATIDGLVQRVLSELATAVDPLIAVIGGLGIRLHAYLPTRTLSWWYTGWILLVPLIFRSRCLPTCWRRRRRWRLEIAVAEGHGETVLLALTGRAGLPASFSVV